MGFLVMSMTWRRLPLVEPSCIEEMISRFLFVC